MPSYHGGWVYTLPGTYTTLHTLGIPRTSLVRCTAVSMPGLLHRW